MTEYLKRKKSLRMYLERKFQNSKSIEKDYRDTIRVTKSWLLNEIGTVEKHIDSFMDNTLFNDVAYADSVANDEKVVEASEKWQLYLPYHTTLYVLCRFLKPDIVVETGVERGSSTYVILKAMDKNGKGVLHSVELCKEISLPKNVKIPLAMMLENEDGLKKRWVLYIGNSLEVLPELKFDGKIDLFVSGSDHSFNVQSFELGWGKSNTREGGVIVCDRSDYNNYRALNEVFPLSSISKNVITLPEKSVKSPLKFTVVRL